MNNIKVGSIHYEWFPYSQVDQQLDNKGEEVRYEYDEWELDESMLILVDGVPIRKRGYYVITGKGTAKITHELLELNEDGYWVRASYHNKVGRNIMTDALFFVPKKIGRIIGYQRDWSYEWGRSSFWDEYTGDWVDPIPCSK